LEAALAQVTGIPEQLEQDSQVRLALERRLETLIRDHTLDSELCWIDTNVKWKGFAFAREEEGVLTG
jgi:hypothetical protein